jgi:UDPglucose--hexose-1-phosphate uridylyltransferase
MNELRWNPSRGEWVVIASRRHTRPILDSDCPFCPGAPEIPDEWVLTSLPNRFAAFSQNAPAVDSEDELNRRAMAFGACEVLLETEEHDRDLADLDREEFYQLMRLYRRRYEELGEREGIDYVFIFRNKGEVIGVSLHHPHGQLYALPFVPPVMARKLEKSTEYMERTGRCLTCDLLEGEADGPRMVASNGSFVCHVPFAPRFPYETAIAPRRHVDSLAGMDDAELYELGDILKTILTKYNGLFGFSLPYVMSLYNSPTDGQDYPQHHFHLEIMPRHRSREQIKYLAGSELGSGVFINDGPPEERAAELRSL